MPIFGTAFFYFCLEIKKHLAMMETTHVSSHKQGADGWSNLTVNKHRNAIERRYRMKQQITIEMTAPYTETITIESNEPFYDIELFAREMLIAAEFRHRARRKKLIYENRETLRNTIVPLWLEREAFTARYKARIENMRKESKRKLSAGVRDLKVHNDFVRSLKDAMDDEDYTDTLRDYTKRVCRELQKIGVPEGFFITKNDMSDIFDRKWWEGFLQIREHRDKDRRNVVTEVRVGMEQFNRMYNIEPYSLDANEMLESYDTIVTAGFGDVILAAALKRGDEICAVMAIDNVQGRRALRHLVGEKQLAKMLNKRIFNTLMRHESLELSDIICHDDICKEMIIIE